ncbi:DUF6130 family protein [Sphingomonas sp. BT-65]|uniref:DUF6130 family protein n=1 Tax=Sphingomonas sp. BT-65 TaxID=2989821 RepID=UPI00223620E5|nr:DUF6130 family protein [Sphingomonas sp. BT-65]MCW4462030.1 DUF6130 family protein [Sphingomonas sp. BT-65]
MNRTFKTIGVIATAFLAATSAVAQTGPASQFIPIPNEPEAKLFVEQPLAGPLASRATVIIPYRTENFRILPIFGPGASEVSPRAGHLHVTVNNLPWHWADAGNTGAIVLAGLPAGQHSVLIEIATPEHRVISGRTVSFTVPEIRPARH